MNNMFNKRKIIHAIIGWMLIIIIMLFLLISCSPSKRLIRLQKNHSYLFEHTMDTVKVLDTTEFVYPGVSLKEKYSESSFLKNIYTPRGLQLDKDLLHIKIKGDPLTDTIYIEADVDTIKEFIIKEIEVPYKVYTPLPRAPTSFWKNKYLFFIALGILLFLFFIRK